MLGYKLTNIRFLGICLFLIVLSIGCYIWYQHELAPYRQQVEEAQQHWEAHQRTISENVDSGTINAIKTIQKDVKNTNLEINIRSEPNNVESFEKVGGDVRVSPHGFGPFPEVPEDYIYQPFSWDSYKNDPPIYELMARVRVKLWKQGIKTTGIRSSNDGLVYPTIPGTVFVKRYKIDDTEYIQIQGSARDDLRAIRESLVAGKTPDGIHVRDMDEYGIDPYKFLNIKKNR